MIVFAWCLQGELRKMVPREIARLFEASTPQSRPAVTISSLKSLVTWWNAYVIAEEEMEAGSLELGEAVGHFLLVAIVFATPPLVLSECPSLSLFVDWTICVALTFSSEKGTPQRGVDGISLFCFVFILRQVSNKQNTSSSSPFAGALGCKPAW